MLGILIDQNYNSIFCTFVSHLPLSKLVTYIPVPQCFVFHLYKGVRAGGGIGDEIESPDGDEYEVYRILFDISFFFFIIVILLAIIQGKAAMNDLWNISSPSSYLLPFSSAEKL